MSEAKPKRAGGRLSQPNEAKPTHFRSDSRQRCKGAGE
jgi:hypothetical protein